MAGNRRRHILNGGGASVLGKTAASFVVATMLGAGLAAMPGTAMAAETPISDDAVVTEGQLSAVNHVVYAVNVGNDSSNKGGSNGEQKNGYAGKSIPFGIDVEDYPYVVNNDTQPQRKSIDHVKYPTALVQGTEPDQPYPAKETKNLDWGYEPSSDANPTRAFVSDAAGWKGERNDLPYFTGRMVNFTSKEQAERLNTEDYQANGGVVYKFEMPKREEGAPSFYDLRLAFYSNESNSAVSVDVNGDRKISNLVVPGDTKLKRTITGVTPDKDGMITVRVHNSDTAVSIWESAANNARVSYIEIDAAKKATAQTLQAQLAETEVTDLKPETSGVTKGTAPYNAAEPVAADVEALSTARKNAQDLAAKGNASADELANASRALQQAFDDVRFVYDYTAVPGATGARLYDTNGNKIQAHGGQIQKIGDTYYWVGEDKSAGIFATGVHQYSSKDMYNWTDNGLILKAFNSSEAGGSIEEKAAAGEYPFTAYNVDSIKNDPDYQAVYGKDFKRFANDKWNENIGSPEAVLKSIKHDLDLEHYLIIERPKIMRNPQGRYVLWFHSDGQTMGKPNSGSYSKARAGVAISQGTDPAGPYKYLGSFRLNSDKKIDGTVDDWTNSYGQSRDMNIFLDSGVDANNDGVDDAYVTYTSDGNSAVYGSLLNSTYTGLASWEDEDGATGQPKRGTDISKGATYNKLFSGQKEAPAPVKYNGKYYLFYSGTSGWVPNGGNYAVADNFLGPYKEIGNPVAEGAVERGSIFISQSSNISVINPLTGAAVYIGDQWFNSNWGNDLGDSRYIVAPVTFDSKNGTMTFNREENFTTDKFAAHASSKVTAVEVKTPPTKLTYTQGEAFDPTGLELTVSFDNKDDVVVNDGYTVSGFDSNKVGNQTVTVTYGEGGNALTATFTITVKANVPDPAPEPDPEPSVDRIDSSTPGNEALEQPVAVAGEVEFAEPAAVKGYKDRSITVQPKHGRAWLASVHYRANEGAPEGADPFTVRYEMGGSRVIDVTYTPVVGKSGASHTAVYRLFNPNETRGGSHVYTTSMDEYNYLVSVGWRGEGTAFAVLADGRSDAKNGTAVHRLYNENDGSHLLSLSEGEVDYLVKAGWKDEGIAFYVSDEAPVDALRGYNPNSGEHLFTVLDAEMDIMVDAGWNSEGVGFKVWVD